MTTSRFSPITRRRLVASSMVGGAAILTAGHLVQAGPGASQPLVPLTQDSGGSVPMFRGNAARTGEMPGPGPNASGGLEELWRFATDGNLFYASSPAVANGVVYVGTDNGNLHAINTSDGIEHWRFATDTGDRVALSAPAVVDGVVYIGSEDLNLYAVNADDGVERWRVETWSSVGSSPAVVDGVVYIGSSDWDRILCALNAEDGSERWRFTSASHFIESTPAVVDGVVYGVDYRGNLYAVRTEDGTERWRFATNISDPTFTPAVADGVVYFSNGSLNSFRGETLFAVNADDGTERWRLTFDDLITTSPAVVDGMVYVGTQREDYRGDLHAINAEDGTERWRFATDSRFESSPVVVDHIVFFGSIDGTLYALDADTGTERWRVVTGDYLGSSPAIVDGVVYIGGGGTLYAIGGRVPALSVGGTARVTEKTHLRGGPAATAVEREELTAGTVVTITGEAVQDGDDVTWWPVTVNDSGAQGWIEASKLEPQTSGGNSEPLILPTEAP